ncbi:hypothetical protein [Methylobacterium haplocladii]|uniref:Uncharacterized protein n=1 Tax=Methylobacterium haplocladii TaxID=1176176 RepID=A0A512IQC8_9HYPH|nr:hypothetical protein [Methylobacterium haplocladii]GEO99890.1 hypothetical protein MHA02_22780 [Methylobacterium haplocladii]GJD82750.1 hypothetical protein HPGCJGGD_0610 [Methylobacterium haplocladii]GLS58054.1 hypothetical protein GCM10007887_07100 [Methylobacterium haplocladii]
MTVTAAPIVRRRLVVHIHGYQLTAPDRFHRRFSRDLSTFGETWSASTETGAPEILPRQAHWQAEAGGPDWRTRTDYRIIRLDDLIAQGHRKPLPGRILLGIRGLFDFLLDRAILGYFRYGWRYAIFTIAPLAMMLASVLAGLFAARWSSGSIGPWFGSLVGIAVFVAGIAFFSKKFYLFILLEDWAFASILARRLEPELAARLDEGSREVRAAIEGGTFDEVLLIGHSLGAVMILHFAEMLLGGLPPETASAPSPTRIALLTIGSSVLKIGLHSAAEPLRRATAAVTSSPRIVWADYWSQHDVMNFPYVDPAVAMGITPLHPPISRKAIFRQMISAEALRAVRFDFFRKHNQFFHAATRRSGYDYFMFTCGPFYGADLARSPHGAMDWLDDRGALTGNAPQHGA